MRVFDEMLGDLAEAIFAGDLAKAEALLGDMQAIGSDAEAETIRRAKRRARPELKVELPPAAPFVLPVPGHLPWSTLGAPRLAEDDAIPLGVQRRLAEEAAR